MDRSTYRSIQRLLAEHGDEDIMPRVLRAEKDFDDIEAFLRIGYEIGLKHGGLWECARCGRPVEDPAHPHSEYGCHILTDGCYDTVLCDDCYRATENGDIT